MGLVVVPNAGKLGLPDFLAITLLGVFAIVMLRGETGVASGVTQVIEFTPQEVGLTTF